jgi:hypothetical protein
VAQIQKRTEPVHNTRIKELLTGSFEDLAGKAQKITVETFRGPWDLWAFPLNTEEVAALASFGEDGADAPARHNLEKAIDLLVLLAREEDGKRMFSESDKLWLLQRVEPGKILEASMALFTVASEYLDTMNERAEGNSETPTSEQS